MRKILVLCLILSAVMSWGQHSTKDSVRISRKAAEGCFRCFNELQSARDSLRVFVQIDSLQNHSVSVLTEVVRADLKPNWRTRLRFFWKESKKTVRDVGIGVLCGILVGKSF
jgi:hypothetical protein